jgi:hypothetical protein
MVRRPSRSLWESSTDRVSVSTTFAPGSTAVIASTRRRVRESATTAPPDAGGDGDGEGRDGGGGDDGVEGGNAVVDDGAPPKLNASCCRTVGLSPTATTTARRPGPLPVG